MIDLNMYSEVSPKPPPVLNPNLPSILKSLMGHSAMGGGNGLSMSGQFERACRETAAAPTFGSSGGYSDRFGLRTGGGFGDTSEYMFKSIIGSGGILSSDDSKCSDTQN